MKTLDLMTAGVASISLDASLDEAVRMMDELDVRHLPVLDGKQLVGVITERDLLEVTGWLGPREREVLGVPDGVVRDHMRKSVVTVNPGAKLQKVLSELVENKIGCLPVVDLGKLVGIVTEMDVLRAYAAACKTGRITPKQDPLLGDLMHTDVEWLGPDATAEDAVAMFEEHGWRHLPIVQDGEVIGIVSDRDIRRERGRGQLELSPLDEIMMPGPICATPDERLSSAAHILGSAKISALPVLEGKKLVGIVTLVDVLAPCAKALAKLSAA